MKSYVTLPQIMNAWGTTDHHKAREFVYKNATPEFETKLGHGLMRFYDPSVIESLRASFHALKKPPPDYVALAAKGRAAKAAKKQSLADKVRGLEARLSLLERAVGGNGSG